MWPPTNFTVEQLVTAFHAGRVTFEFAPKFAPEVAWTAIVELSRQPLTDRQIALLAAGPLEDLLKYHGPDYIDRIEKEARTYQAFRHLLGGVWRNTIAEPVWRRVEAIRGPAW